MGDGTEACNTKMSKQFSILRSVATSSPFLLEKCYAAIVSSHQTLWTTDMSLTFPSKEAFGENRFYEYPRFGAYTTTSYIIT